MAFTFHLNPFVAREPTVPIFAQAGYKLSSLAVPSEVIS
jgi:hypothetical protein